MLLGVVGAAVGSFLNVVIHRLPRGETLVSPGSRCPSCETPLRPYENVPIVSWLVLHGRCRTCGARISPRYLVVELLTAATFAGVAVARGVDEQLIAELPFAAALIVVAGIDLEHRIIPNRVLLPAAIWAVVAATLLDPLNLPELLIAGAAAFFGLLLAALAYPAGMGMGDVKLGGVMGLYLGASVAPALLAAFASGSATGVAILLREGGSARKKGIPFAPFLALGGLVGVLVGPELIAFYKDHFLS